jgi:hypothetical protein
MVEWWEKRKKLGEKLLQCRFVHKESHFSSSRGSEMRCHRLIALAAAWLIRETLSPLNNVLNNLYNCTDQEKNVWRKKQEKNNEKARGIVVIEALCYRPEGRGVRDPMR